MTLLYFVLAGLDLLDAVNQIPETKRFEIVEWIYGQQVLPDSTRLRTWVTHFDIV